MLYYQARRCWPGGGNQAFDNIWLDSLFAFSVMCACKMWLLGRLILYKARERRATALEKKQKNQPFLLSICFPWDCCNLVHSLPLCAQVCSVSPALVSASGYMWHLCSCIYTLVKQTRFSFTWYSPNVGLKGPGQQPTQCFMLVFESWLQPADPRKS